ncbi:hypothetical protein PR048_029501 [Dryococelus australis]|uniref:Uncharacterized protein n=1 Tax=Dryococelus australis TaxID=614101 RepID=A0ABQ9GG81_9NEOP|nr:hypothetical protein PR048_029501 [Dryococelus australis]
MRLLLDIMKLVMEYGDRNRVQSTVNPLLPTYPNVPFQHSLPQPVATFGMPQQSVLNQFQYPAPSHYEEHTTQLHFQHDINVKQTSLPPPAPGINNPPAVQSLHLVSPGPLKERDHQYRYVGTWTFRKSMKTMISVALAFLIPEACSVASDSMSELSENLFSRPGVDWQTAFGHDGWQATPFCWRVRFVVRCINGCFHFFYLNFFVCKKAAAPERKGGRNVENPEKTRRPVASYSTIPTCENPGVTRPGIEPGSPWWEASRLTTQPPRSLLRPLSILELSSPTFNLGSAADQQPIGGVRVIRHQYVTMDEPVKCEVDVRMRKGRRGYKLQVFSFFIVFRAIDERSAGEVTSEGEVCVCEYQAVKGAKRWLRFRWCECSHSPIGYLRLWEWTLCVIGYRARLAKDSLSAGSCMATADGGRRVASLKAGAPKHPSHPSVARSSGAHNPWTPPPPPSHSFDHLRLLVWPPGVKGGRCLLRPSGDLRSLRAPRSMRNVPKRVDGGWVWGVVDEHPTWHRALAVTPTKMADCTDQRYHSPRL